MLTAFVICYFISELSLTHPYYTRELVFLIFLAAVIDFGIWTLGESYKKKRSKNE